MANGGWLGATTTETHWTTQTVRLDCLFVRRHAGVVTATRVSQADRTRAMRARLLEATVELLIERGFTGTSTTLVSERAGVSRGAQLHHFPTKNDLVVAAVTHLTEVRAEGLRMSLAALRAPGRVEIIGDAALIEEVADLHDDGVFAGVAERAQHAHPRLTGREHVVRGGSQGQRQIGVGSARR